MTYTLRLRDVTIGRSELEHRDPGANLASGVFRPGFGYELVQPVFRLFSQAVPESAAQPTDEEKLARYYQARDSLPLELFDGGGRKLATSRIHIADRTEEIGRDAIELEVVVGDPAFWEGHVPGR
jgi:hypothetical protein